MTSSWLLVFRRECCLPQFQLPTRMRIPEVSILKSYFPSDGDRNQNSFAARMKYIARNLFIIMSLTGLSAAQVEMRLFSLFLSF